MGLSDKNLYAYCDNNPVMRKDSNGKIWHLLAGAAVGVATQFISDHPSSLGFAKRFSGLTFGSDLKKQGLF